MIKLKSYSTNINHYNKYVFSYIAWLKSKQKDLNLHLINALTWNELSYQCNTKNMPFMQ